jgi:hypothetical protein
MEEKRNTFKILAGRPEGTRAQREIGKNVG